MTIKDSSKNWVVSSNAQRRD